MCRYCAHLSGLAHTVFFFSPSSSALIFLTDLTNCLYLNEFCEVSQGLSSSLALFDVSFKGHILSQTHNYFYLWFCFYFYYFNIFNFFTLY